VKIYDAHCDTIEKITDFGKQLYKNDCHCDLERMDRFDWFFQVFAVCVYPEFMGIKAFERANLMIDKFHEQLIINSDKISLCKCYKDIKDAEITGKMGALLSLEGASPLMGRAENLEFFFQKGVRLITLTWNHKNELGNGVLTEDEGLTDFGIDIVRQMNEKGIVIDVSHLSDRGFYDVCKYSQKPFAATHSNSRKICENRRNLTDDMIICLSKQNGYIGLNLYPYFITGKMTASTDDIVRHIEHIISVGGENVLGLGCDFDGIDYVPTEIDEISKVGKIAERLLQLNYSQEITEKIMYKNFDQFLKNALLHN